MRWSEVSTADKFGIAGLMIGGVIAVLLTVDANFFLRFLGIAILGGGGFALGRLIGAKAARR